MCLKVVCAICDVIKMTAMINLPENEIITELLFLNQIRQAWYQNGRIMGLLNQRTRF